MLAIINIFTAAALISLVSWLSGKNTRLAGFLTALPLTTLIALAFSHARYQNSEQSVAYAKSIFIAIPLSLLFFVPFLVATKFNLNFWFCYVTGIALLAIGYFIHQYASRSF